MSSNPITFTALATPLTTRAAGCGHIQPRSRLISEAYAQT
jgi:hypothetical protein